MAFISLFGFLPKQEVDKSLARVPKTQGKYVFIRCEPVVEYDVVFDYTFMTWSGTPEEMATAGIESAKKRAKSKQLDFDGIIIGSGAKDIAIKFK